MSSAISTEGLDLNSLVYMAKAAEQAKRYDEMLQYMKAVTKLEKDLNVEERNLLYVACKNIIGPRRTSWRIVSSIESKEAARSNTARVEHMRRYRANIENELQSICNDIVTMLEDNLLPKTEEPESKIFYHKLEGDCNRFLAEFLQGEPRQIAATASEKKYIEATGLASKKLASTHPLRLELALDFSSFYCEIAKSPERACQLATEAFNDAISEIDNLNEENYKDSTRFMHLLRDNLVLYVVLVASGNTVNLSEALRAYDLNEEGNPDEGVAATTASATDAGEETASTEVAGNV